MEAKEITRFSVASCIPDGGILTYCLTEDGRAEQLSEIRMPMPMTFLYNGDLLYTALRAPFSDTKESGIAVWNAKSGQQLSEISSTRGEVACHMAMHRGRVYVANYISGSLFSTQDRLAVHTGKGKDRDRQEAPHVHSVAVAPSGDAILSCDLGTDEVYVYDLDLRELSREWVPGGNGPRHLVFSKDGRFVYVMNELSATLSVFSYRERTLTYLRDFDPLPAGYCGARKGAAIRRTADGRRLYLSERGSESIILLKAEGEDLTVIGRYPSFGEEPRDIALVAGERFLLCANQFSDTVTVFRVLPCGELEKTDTILIQAPIAVGEC